MEGKILLLAIIAFVFAAAAVTMQVSTILYSVSGLSSQYTISGYVISTMLIVLVVVLLASLGIVILSARRPGRKAAKAA